MKIKLGHMDLQVEPMSAYVKAETRSWGTFYAGDHTIRIDSELCPAEQGRVLIHELIHAVWHALNIPAEIKEEEACGMMDRGLSEIIRRNPTLLPRLQAALNGEQPIVGRARA